MAAIICGLIWSGLTGVALMGTVWWSLPRLAHKKELARDALPAEPADAAAASAEGQEQPAGKRYLTTKWIVVLCIGVLLAGLCGWRSFQTTDTWVSMVKVLIAFLVLACASVTDAELFLIPNKYPLILVVSRVLCIIPELVVARESVLSRLFSSVLGAVFCLIVLMLTSKITRGGLGYGDVKLLSALGFLCGLYMVIYTLVISCFLCALVSIGLLVTKKKKMKDILPMGPFVFFGYMIVLLLAIY